MLSISRSAMLFAGLSGGMLMLQDASASVPHQSLSAVAHCAGADASLLCYYWQDGRFSTFDKTEGRFKSHNLWSNKTLVLNWPQGKVLAEVTPLPRDVNSAIYYWQDGSYSVYDKQKKSFSKHYSNTAAKIIGGWPEGKFLAATLPHPQNGDKLDVYFWQDGGYSFFDKKKGYIVKHFGPSDEKLIHNWPMKKKLAAIAPNPQPGSNNWIFYWQDGTFDTLEKYSHVLSSAGAYSRERLIRNWSMQDLVLDPKKHQVTAVKIQQDYPGKAIYANGRMQKKVTVFVQVKDLLGRGVQLHDKSSAINQQGSLQDLVTLYIKNKGINKDGGNLLIDGQGTYASTSWKASRVDKGYAKLLPQDAGSTPLSIARGWEAKYPKEDGWNQYTYWLDSVMAGQNVEICAQAGTVGASLDSCATDSSVIITTKEPEVFIHPSMVKLELVYFDNNPYAKTAHWRVVVTDSIPRLKGVEWQHYGVYDGALYIGGGGTPSFESGGIETFVGANSWQAFAVNFSSPEIGKTYAFPRYYRQAGGTGLNSSIYNATGTTNAADFVVVGGYANASKPYQRDEYRNFLGFGSGATLTHSHLRGPRYLAFTNYNDGYPLVGNVTLTDVFGGIVRFRIATSEAGSHGGAMTISPN
ncbi:hypothetical protein [Chromobacterium haemolyticum]|uniref:hypothetical protein n=1 Tax=Chromobacterium haemolyticum TaxID=394935 RepID=UPI0011778627|nr:hypothetical protein [Chromobacterium haemolyticum]